MGPKRSSKKELGAPAASNQCAPIEWQQANEALVLYQRGKRDKAIQKLDELLASKPSGAACLARAKIWVTQAVDVGLKAEGAEQREAVMLPLFHQALAVAARGAAEHRSLGCAKLAMVLLCSCAGRGGTAGAAARSGASELLQQLVGNLEREAKERGKGASGAAAQAQSMGALFSPPAWEDVPKDRWPLEFGLRDASQLGEFAAETVQNLREALDTTEVAEVCAANKAGGQVLAGGFMELEGLNGEKVQRLAPNPDIPADMRLVETHTLRKSDIDALTSRYREEQRAQEAAVAAAVVAQGAPLAGSSGPGVVTGSGRAGGAALLGASLEQQRLQITGISTDQDAAKLQQRLNLDQVRRNKDYVNKQQHATKVAQFLEKQLAGLGDRELVQSRVLALAEVPTSVFKEAVRELGAAGALRHTNADKLLKNIGRLERGIPIYYRWLDVAVDESQQAPSSSPTAGGSQGQPAAAQRSESQSTEAAAAQAGAAGASSGGDVGAGPQAQHAQQAEQAEGDAATAASSSSEAGKLELRHGEDYFDGPSFEQAALAKLLATAQVEQLEKMLPPCPFAQRWSDGMPSLSLEVLDSLVSKDILIPDSTPVQLLPDDVAVLREQDALIQRAIKAHAVLAVTGSSTAGSAGASAAEEEGGAGGAGAEGGTEVESFDSAHLRALMEAAADGSSGCAVQEKASPVAWLEVYRSLQDANRGVLGVLDGTARSVQQESEQLISDSGRQAFLPDPVQSTRDNLAFTRCLLGLELLRFGAAAASAAGPQSVPLQRLEAVHRLLAQDSADVIDAIDVLEEGVANRQLAGMMSACVLGVVPQGSSAGSGNSSGPDAASAGSSATDKQLAGAASAVIDERDASTVDGTGSCSSITEPVSCTAGFSPVTDGALLALARLPRLPPNATAQQAEEQAAQVKQQLVSEALAGLRQLLARGRLPSGVLASMAMFIWASLQSTQQMQQAQQAGSQEEAARRRAEFEDLWWRRRSEAISAQMLRVGELGLMPLLQLYTFVGLQYGAAFQAVGDICLDFQRRLMLGEAWAAVDRDAGVVRLAPAGLEWVEEKKQEADKVSKPDGAANPHRTSGPAGAGKPGGSKRSSSAASQRKDSGGKASGGALASPRGLANASLLALAEFGYGAMEARANLVPASGETWEEQIAKVLDFMPAATAEIVKCSGRVRRLLGTLGMLCPRLQSVRALLARSEETGAHLQRLLAQLSQGEAESEKVERELLLEQAEELGALGQEAGQALLQLYALMSALDSAHHSRAVDLLEAYYMPQVEDEHGRCRAEELVQAHYIAGADARQLLTACCEQQSAQLPGMAQLSQAVGQAVELLHQAAEAAGNGGATGSESGRLQLDAAVRAALEAQAKAAATLDLGAAKLQGLLEAVATEALATTGRMLQGYCCFSCLNDIGVTLLSHVLPRRWERQMEEARERELAELASQEAAMAELLALEQSKAAAEAARAEKRREKKKAKKAERRPQQAQQQQQQDPAAEAKQEEADALNAPGKSGEPAPPEQQPGLGGTALEVLAGPPTPPATVVPEVQEQEVPAQCASCAGAPPVQLVHTAGPAPEGHAGEAMTGEGAAPGQAEEESGAPAAAAAAAVGVAAGGEVSGAPAAAEDSSPGTPPEAEEDGWVVAHVQRRHRQGKAGSEGAAGGQQQQQQPKQAAAPAEAAKASRINSSAAVAAAVHKARQEEAPAAAPPALKSKQEEAPAAASEQQQEGAPAAASEQQQEGAPAAAAAQQQKEKEEKEEEKWEVAQSHRRRQPKRGGEALSPLSPPGGSSRVSPRENGTAGSLSRTASSSDSGGARGPTAMMQHSAARHSSTPQPAGPMHVCSWRGDWMCVCGRRNFPRSHCKGCGQYCPCRNWVFEGACHRSDCMFPHPPFSLPAAKPPLAEDGLAKEGYALVVPPPPGTRPAVESMTGRPPSQQRTQEQQQRQQQLSGAASVAGSSRTPAASPRAVASGTCLPAKPAAAPPPPAKAAAPGSTQPRSEPPPSPQATAAHNTSSSGSSSGASARPQEGASTQGTAAAVSRPASDGEGSAPAEPAPALAPPAAAPAPAALAPAAAGSAWASIARPKTAPPRLPPSGSTYWPLSPHATLPPAAAPTAAAAQPTAAAPAAEVDQPLSSPAVSAAGTAQPAGAVGPSSPPAASPSKPPPSKSALNPHASAFSPSSPSPPLPVAAAAAASQPPAAGGLPASGAWSSQAKQHRQQQQAQQQEQQAQQAQQHRSQEEKEEEELETLLAMLKGNTGDATEQQPAEQAAPPAEPPPRPAPGLAAVALTNGAGEYNCFLNVVLQCLWHCSEFRRLVEGWPAELYGADPVVRALHDLFAAFADRELGGVPQAAAGSGLQACIAAQGVNPAPLREALAALPAQEFKAGEMCDASELLLTIYEHVQAVAARTGHAAGVDSLFGLPVQESVHCGACKRTTRQSRYTQYLHCAQATAIRGLLTVAGAEKEARPSLGQLLRMIEEQARKSCDQDAGGCGAWNPVMHVLERAPRVFTLQLAWERHREVATDIAATLAGVQEQVDLGEVYCGRDAGRDMYRLRAMACFYSSHYQAFVLVPSLGRWVMFDDSKVSHVGTWADVRAKCGLGRIQPSALFYEAAA